MIRKYLGLIILLSFLYLSSKAQEENTDSTPQLQDVFSLLQDNSYGGEMNLYQNPSLHVLIDKSTRLNEKDGLIGFRIQIYSGSGGEQAKINQEHIMVEFIEAFPQFDPSTVYKDYQAPYFKVRVGDFRNKNEAFEFYNDVKDEFPGSYIVKSRINFPILEGSENK
ncbi:MAG: hypothetical protein PF517_01140 [Salinivirgaceae bacterium]|jgi:hypothetical protein|nr:hypothetical protein [Salinivirgaceae bacterium]